MPEPVGDLPFSQAAANNGHAILEQLRRRLAHSHTVFEIGAGTGQHAVQFATAMPWLRWQPSEHPAALTTLQPRCAAAGLTNLDPPCALDICARPWDIDWPDALYTANTLHIVPEASVAALFAACAEQAARASQLIVYGPFNYGGRYTAASNADFDRWLKARDPESGIRDVEWVNALAQRAGFVLDEDIAMPANNRLLCWQRAD